MRRLKWLASTDFCYFSSFVLFWPVAPFFRCNVRNTPKGAGFVVSKEWWRDAGNGQDSRIESLVETSAILSIRGRFIVENEYKNF